MTLAHSRRLGWLLAVTTLVPIGLLSWLGVWILRQDRAADSQRQREALGVAAGRLALDIERRLQDVEEELARGEGVPLAAAGPISTAERPLLYRAAVDPPALPDSPLLSVAEGHEFRSRDYARAATAFRALAQSADTRLRAAALLGLGRVLRKTGDHGGALRAYAELDALGHVMVAGQPASLVARQGRGRIFEETGDRVKLGQEAAALSQALARGDWPIDRPTFEVYQDLVRRWGGPDPSPLSEATWRTEAAMRLWQSWRANGLTPRGRSVFLLTAESPVLAVWNNGPDEVVAWLGTPRDLEALLAPLWASHQLTASAHTIEGHRLFGAARPDGVNVMPIDTRLPFILSVAHADSTAAGGRDRARRAVLASSLALAFVLMLAAAYGVYRATSRELALARQQTDFVAAVSHEFRTPLTSMRHLTDLLATRGVTSEERRAHYYGLLAHETDRLHRVVESLLTFGRIEAGAYAWRLEPVKLDELLANVIGEFLREPQAGTRTIVREIESDLPPVAADAEALSRALANLLDNAMKYSEHDTSIRVFARLAGTSVQVGVGDRGIGIPPGERARIFQKFVRGAGASRAGTGGVGIGLALVKRIVEGHGGSISVESEPGCGSTFTIRLPVSPGA